MPLFILDTSIWIRIKDNYPPNVFKKFWQQLDASIAAGTIRSPEDVLKELEKGTDDTAAMLKAKPNLFVPLDDAFQTVVEEVVAACRDLADWENERSLADPFVVALGKHLSGTVVTDEKARKAPEARRKIPDACKELGIPCRQRSDFFDFLAEIGWDL